MNELENRYEKLNIFKKIKDNWILLNKIKLVLNTGNINNSLINECKNYDIKNEANKNYDKELDIEIPQEEDINKILEKINNLLIIINCIFDSSIIKNDYKKQNIINSWIKEKMNKNIIKYELIYKMSENGSRPDDFHEFCDNKGPTLTIIETKNNYIFGGFTPLNWSTNNKDSYDQSKRTFIFSLNLMKKYEMFNSKKRAIFCDIDHGPSFGNNSFNGYYYSSNCDINLNTSFLKGKICAIQDSNFLENEKLELIGERGKIEAFDTKEIEVFQIIFE